MLSNCNIFLEMSDCTVPVLSIEKRGDQFLLNERRALILSTCAAEGGLRVGGSMGLVGVAGAAVVVVVVALAGAGAAPAEALPSGRRDCVVAEEPLRPENHGDA